MISAREIKNRINSVKNTSKITHSLELISANKLSKAQQRVVFHNSYIKNYKEIIDRLLNNSEVESIYVNNNAPKKKAGVIVVGTSRGFVGGMVINILKKFSELKTQLLGEGMKIFGVNLFKTSHKVLDNAGILDYVQFDEFKDYPNTEDITAIKEYIFTKFLDREFDEVYIVYTEFISTSRQNVVTKKILPLERNLEQAEGDSVEFTYEPGKEEILNKLIPEYIENMIFNAVLNSIASEHANRMISMKNATDNAKELESDLNLTYNKTRQENITNQIIEVVSGTFTNI
jgi:F-type H+-transporting ATPase subunit gamma